MWTGFLQSLLLLLAALSAFLALMSAGRLGLAVPLWRRPVIATALQTVQVPTPAPAPPAAVAPFPQDENSDGNVGAGDGQGDSSYDAAAEDGGSDGEADPDDADLDRATRLVDDGDSVAALALLKDILQRNPRNEAALVEKAMIELLDLKQPDLATKSLQTVMQIDPHNQIALSELVGLYQEQGKTSEGLAFLQAQNQEHPGSPDLAFGIGQLLANSGRLTEATSYLEKAAESSDHEASALHMLGDSYLQNGEPDKAIDALGRSIASQERDIQAQEADGYSVDYARERLAYSKMDRAQAYLNHGDLEQAQQLVEEAQKTIPTDPMIDTMLDTLAKRRGG